MLLKLISTDSRIFVVNLYRYIEENF